LNQEPPRAQQLIFLDFAMMPHLGHTELMIVGVRSGDFYEGIGQTQKEEIIGIEFTMVYHYKL
jgi:hypothetical protein